MKKLIADALELYFTWWRAYVCVSTDCKEKQWTLIVRSLSFESGNEQIDMEYNIVPELMDLKVKCIDLEEKT